MSFLLTLILKIEFTIIKHHLLGVMKPSGREFISTWPRLAHGAEIKETKTLPQAATYCPKDLLSNHPSSPFLPSSSLCEASSSPTSLTSSNCNNQNENSPLREVVCQWLPVLLCICHALSNTHIALDLFSWLPKPPRNIYFHELLRVFLECSFFALLPCLLCL